jgi:hypothetical protein
MFTSYENTRYYVAIAGEGLQPICSARSLGGTVAGQPFTKMVFVSGFKFYCNFVKLTRRTLVPL